MAYKQILFHSKAREKLLSGTKALADAVRVTLGPKSKSVLIQRKWGTPIVCNDGVTIAKEIKLKDPEEDLGAQMLRQAAEKTGDLVGDGTSTATLLAEAIFAEGIRNVVAGASAIEIRRGLDRGKKAAVDVLRGLSQPVKSRVEKVQVATISAHNDVYIGELVADAIEKVGDEGAITVEDSRTIDTVLEVVEGMQFDRGYISPYFVTETEDLTCDLENVLVFLHDKKLSSLRPLIPFLESVVQQNSPLLIIAEDVTEEALATLVVNKLRGGLRVVAVKAPGFGDRRRAMIEDIAVLTGGQLISEEVGTTLESLSIEQLGRANRVICTGDTTTIIGGEGDKDHISERINQIRAAIDATTSDYDREKLEERLAKLAGGVAVIRVGAPSEAEVKSRKEALDDAISATKAAMEEGIVPGGGLALLRCTQPIMELAEKAEGDERTGLLILCRALSAPTRQIADNSAVDGGVVVARMLESKGALGFDAAKNEYVDLLNAGIVDPTKVVRTALENAVSVAGTLLLTEATMTEVEEEKDKLEQQMPQGL
ncbi:chaperonin GroEL [Ruegeria arenilitoris]|uniref:chaperonin GroEL n=1 Tax=Ruegeria arenilitoris TaxID=1173585 RepID=UPI00147DBA8A|nr:chaperonin GroEL [Ruegeria arenilitoris]